MLITHLIIKKEIKNNLFNLIPSTFLCNLIKNTFDSKKQSRKYNLNRKQIKQTQTTHFPFIFNKKNFTFTYYTTATYEYEKSSKWRFYNIFFLTYVAQFNSNPNFLAP